LDNSQPVLGDISMQSVIQSRALITGFLIFAITACAEVPSSQVQDSETYDADREDAAIFECHGQDTSVEVFPDYSNDPARNEFFVKVDHQSREIRSTVDGTFSFSVREGGALRPATD